MTHIINIFIYNFGEIKIHLNPEANNSFMPATFSEKLFRLYIILIRVQQVSTCHFCVL